MSATVELPSSLDFEAVPELLAQLLIARGQELTVDAAEVAFIGTLAMQVLMSARRQWVIDGCRMTIARPSDAFTQAVAACGISQSELDQEDQK